MTKQQALPPELLLIIFEMVLVACLDPIELCKYLTFPEFNRRLRSAHWQEDARFSHLWLRNLRSVCQTFKTLVTSMWPYKVITEDDMTICSTVGLLYTARQIDGSTALQRLFSSSFRPYDVIAMDIMLDNPVHPKGHPTQAFDALCQCAHLLPNVCSLILGIDIFTDSKLNDFWGRLNTAFPHLVCLVLRGSSSVLHDEQLVTYKELEILDLDEFDPNLNVQFPVLRHASLGWYEEGDIPWINKWTSLESLHLRSIKMGASVDWAPFPRLNTLGVPRSDITACTPAPAEHPLHNLHVYVDTTAKSDSPSDEMHHQRQLNWFKDIIQRFPLTTQVTLDFQKQGHYTTPWIRGDFREEDITPLGFTIDRERREIIREAKRVVLKRLQPTPWI